MGKIDDVFLCVCSQLHFIFRHKNPKTGEIEEKHAKKPSGNLDSYFTDKKTHLYTLGLSFYIILNLFFFILCLHLFLKKKL